MKAQAEVRSDFLGMAWLGLAGLMSAISLLLLSSSRIPGLQPEAVTQLLLAMQWHALGWAATKLGVDYAVFNIVAKHAECTFSLMRIARGPMSLVWSAFVAVSIPLFGWQVSFLLALALLADTLSAIRNAELNARRRFRTTAIANLLYYPLFVCLWTAFALEGFGSLLAGLTLLAASSWVRLAWFVMCGTGGRASTTESQIASHRLPALQGLLNVSLFRTDQIALSVSVLGTIGAVLQPEFLGQYVFLGRVIDVATGIMVMIGTVLFPRHALPPPGSGRTNNAAGQFLFAGLLVCAVIGLLAVSLSVLLFAGDRPPWPIWVAFALQIPLTFAANFLTFSFQLDERFHALLRNQFLSVMAGTPPIAHFVIHGQLVVLACTIPLQLLVFITLCLTLDWGKQQRIFTKVVP